VAESAAQQKAQQSNHPPRQSARAGGEGVVQSRPIQEIMPVRRSQMEWVYPDKAFVLINVQLKLVL